MEGTAVLPLKYIFKTLKSACACGREGREDGSISNMHMRNFLV